MVPIPKVNTVVNRLMHPTGPRLHVVLGLYMGTHEHRETRVLTGRSRGFDRGPDSTHPSYGPPPPLQSLSRSGTLYPRRTRSHERGSVGAR